MIGPSADMRIVAGMPEEPSKKNTLEITFPLPQIGSILMSARVDCVRCLMRYRRAARQTKWPILMVLIHVLSFFGVEELLHPLMSVCVSRCNNSESSCGTSHKLVVYEILLFQKGSKILHADIIGPSVVRALLLGCRQKRRWPL